MKSINSNELIESLQGDVRQLILWGEQLKNLPSTLLQLQPAAGKWSVAQVLEHLDVYSRYYLNAIESKLHLHQTAPAKLFRPGWLGNYFTSLMKPAANGSISKKMKAPKNALPARQPDLEKVLEEFIQQQHQLLNLLQVARNANLEQVKIPTSLSRLIRLKLGDTFRFFIAHEQRHFIQIENNIRSLSANSNIKILVQGTSLIGH